MTNIKPAKSQKQKAKSKTIGVLALQGDFLEHLKILQSLGINTIEVKLLEDLGKIDGIILPGGESTTMARLFDVFDLRKPLQEKIQKGLPVWGTCAGMILLAKKIVQPAPIPLALLDITVNRNAYGRQIDSFEMPLKIKVLGEKVLNATFIRAPRIESIGPNVEILAKLDDEIVAVKQNNILATSFHPELTQDTRFHEYLMSLVNAGIF